jgi:hypothetical protein
MIKIIDNIFELGTLTILNSYNEQLAVSKDELSNFVAKLNKINRLYRKPRKKYRYTPPPEPPPPPPPDGGIF